MEYLCCIVLLTITKYFNLFISFTCAIVWPPYLRNMMQLVLSDRYFLRDPLHTELGTNIVAQSILMIDQLGFEQFTFKKLAQPIGSTEASIYRYYSTISISC